MIGAGLRLLTPLGKAGLIALVLILVLILGLGVLWAGVGWDPFGWRAKRLERAETRAAVATSDALARGLEVEGERRQHARIDAQNQVVKAAEVATTLTLQQSGAADDASVPLEPARAARLGAHDRELCRIVPDLDGCAATTEPD